MLKLKASQTSHMSAEQFMQTLKKFKAKSLDQSLINLYMEQFKEITQSKNEVVNVHEMADHYLARHPTTEPHVNVVRRRRRLRRIRNNV